MGAIRYYKGGAACPLEIGYWRKTTEYSVRVSVGPRRLIAEMGGPVLQAYPSLSFGVEDKCLVVSRTQLD